MNTKPRDKDRFPDLVFPSINWRWEFTLALISTVLGFIVYFHPEYATSNSTPKIIIGLILIGIPLFPLIYWGISVTLISIKRIFYYPKLLETLIHETNNYRELQLEYTKRILQIYGEHELEIIKALYIKNKFHIVLSKNKASNNIVEGTEIIVVDKEDSLEMGRFQISEIRKREYYATGIIVNPVWLGFIKEKGEVTTFPNLIASSCPRNDF